MTYIVTDACVKCKFMDCVEVCPVDCFYEGENFLAIHPDECIDCGVCEPECPVDAIKPDTEDDPDGKWLTINTQYAKIWPNITVKGEPPEDREEYERETGKFEKYFSEKPGTVRRPAVDRPGNPFFSLNFVLQTPRPERSAMPAPAYRKQLNGKRPVLARKGVPGVSPPVRNRRSRAVW
jgi:ferredoxin